MRSHYFLTVIAALGVGCADTGQDRTSLTLFVVGADVAEPVVAAADVPIIIDRADLAFGPLYLCAGTTAGELCETARLEWLDTVVVDTTNPEVARAGELIGVTGPVRSWMYDLGISSQLSREDPYILDAALELGGMSFVLEGRALVTGIEVPFAVSVPIQQTDDTELGVPVIRKSLSETFSRDVTSDESPLTVRFDPAPWVEGINFAPYVSREACAPEGSSTVCDGTIERSCDSESGSELDSRDCGELNQICIPDQGCAERLTLDSDTEAYRSVRNALVVGVRPIFDWDFVP